jgi:hypothetical protein
MVRYPKLISVFFICLWTYSSVSFASVHFGSLHNTSLKTNNVLLITDYLSKSNQTLNIQSQESIIIARSRRTGKRLRLRYRR